TDDLGAIVNLERYCFPPEVAFGRSRWHYLLAHAKGRTLLLLDEKHQLMGYLCLLEQVIHEGKAAGWGAIRLEVGDANEEALALYQGLGFRPQQRLADYYGRDQHAHRLVLPLVSDEERERRRVARTQARKPSSQAN
ncbi:MAG: GNAT family N-acetyltransferase, partial [Aeromonas veronii]